jgi:lysophospholipase L1-like esterase
MEYRRIIIFGHSFVHGLWDRQGGWVQRLQREMYDNYLNNHETPWDENYCNVFNAGITNENSRKLVSRFETDLKERKTDEKRRNLVLIQFGVNSAQIKD